LKGQGALPAGTRLDEFEIIRVLGAGGFGIVYLALDQVLLRYVAIKEYMPAALAGRGAGATVVVRSPQQADTFAMGLESFFSEARMLASFDHPSLVKVHRFWKANGTAYMVMQYYPGQTLKEARQQMKASPNEVWLRNFVEPVLGALEVLHDENVYHRDIAPDNILLLPDGRPVLLDFGSARRAIGDRTQSLTAILKPNFAPVEQYADEPSMRQGPWTDLYALGATVRFMLTAQVPVPAVMRAVRDAMPALSAPGAVQFAGVGVEFLATIDWALALAPEDRPQSVATMRHALNGDIRPPAPGDDASSRTNLAAQAGACVDVETEAVEREAGPRETAPPLAPVKRAPETGEGQRPRVSTRYRASAFVVLIALVGALVWTGLRSQLTVPTKLLALPAPVAPAPAAAVAAATTPPPAILLDTERSATATAAPGSVLNEAPTPRMAPASSPTVQAAKPRHDRGTASAAPSRPEVSTASVKPTVLAPAPKRTAVAEAEAEVIRATPAIYSRSPRELCGDMNFISLAICVSRECQATELQAHPQCIESRRYDEERKRRSDH
jgi:hypothetical protein